MIQHFAHARISLHFLRLGFFRYRLVQLRKSPTVTVLSSFLNTSIYCYAKKPSAKSRPTIKAF